MTMRQQQGTKEVILEMAMALARLGATDGLSSAERTLLDEQGFLVFEALLDASELSTLHRRLDDLERSGQDFVDYEHAVRMHHLHLYGEMFDRLWLDPKLLAVTAHLMGGEFKMYQLALRAASPGGPSQHMHVDSGPRRDGSGRAALVNSVWMLDNFTAANGATRLIPGSHHWTASPYDLEDGAAPHPMEISIEAPAGSLMIFSGHVWHRGGGNATSRTRRGMFCGFHERDVIPPDDHLALYEKHRPLSGAKETESRLSEAARYLLGD